MAKALTVKHIESIEKQPAPSKRQEIPDGLLVGLYLVRQPSKAMSWAVRYRHAGRPRKLTIGAYPAINLEAARDVGSKALRAAAEGRDPAQEKQSAKVEEKRRTVEELRAQRDLIENVAREFIERYAKPRAAGKNRPNAWVETGRILGLKPDPADPRKLVEAGGDVIPRWRGRKIQQITKRDVISLLDEIQDRGAPIMANRVLAAVRKLFNWAASRDIIGASPCVGVTPPGAEKSRDRVLTDNELRMVWTASEAEPWPYGPIIKLMILTGQREAEVAGMFEEEIKSDKRTWSMEGPRTKNGEAHEVPLSDPVLQVIGAQPRIGRKRFLFSSDGESPVKSFSRVKRRIDAAVQTLNGGKPIPDWVFHDLRRTVASGMAALGIQLPVIEKVLNHKSGTFRGIVGVYQRHSFAEEKRAALDAWATFVLSLLNDEPCTNVVPMRAR